MLRTVNCRLRDIFLHCVACLRRQQEQNAIHYPPIQTWVLYNRKSSSARKQTNKYKSAALFGENSSSERKLKISTRSSFSLMIANAKYDTFSSCANQ